MPDAICCQVSVPLTGHIPNEILREHTAHLHVNAKYAIQYRGMLLVDILKTASR
jgi:hypothetical protein